MASTATAPYTSALAETMQKPGYGLFKTFNEVGLAVDKATGGQQLPWVSSSPISGNFYFAGKAEPAAPEVKQASLTPESSTLKAPLMPDTPLTATPTQEPRFSPPDDPLRQGIVTDCDRLAAMPHDTGMAGGYRVSKPTR